MSNKYQELFIEGKPDIVKTRKLVQFIEDGIGTKDQEQRTNIGANLIQVKAIRDQTVKIKDQTEAIEKSSESSDKLGLIGLIFSGCLVLVGYSQIIISGEGLSRCFLWGNVIIIGIFLILFLLIYKKGKN